MENYLNGIIHHYFKIKSLPSIVKLIESRVWVKTKIFLKKKMEKKKIVTWIPLSRLCLVEKGHLGECDRIYSSQITLIVITMNRKKLFNESNKMMKKISRMMKTKKIMKMKMRISKNQIRKFPTPGKVLSKITIVILFGININHKDGYL